jgi:hypothetical protein
MNPSVSRKHKRTQITQVLTLGLYSAAVLAVALVFNLWPEKIASGTRVGNVWTWSPLLTTAFSRYLPELNALWGLSILLHVVQIGYRRDSSLLRGASLLLQVYGAVLMGIMASGAPALFAPSAASWAAGVLVLLSVTMSISGLSQIRHLFNLETVTFQWEDAEMDHV